MVSALDSGLNGPSSSAGLGHCVVFLGKVVASESIVGLPSRTCRSSARSVSNSLA